VTLSNLAHRAAKAAADNSPLILTAIGVAGTISTAVLAAKGGIKATHYLSSRAPHTSTRDYIERTWRFYLPAVLTGAGTITCIICANRIGTRRAAAMAAAYSLSQEAMSEYKTKVIEKIGENKERKIREEIAQDRVNQNPPREDLAIIGDLEVRCYEQFTGRYFSSNMETLKAAQNAVNHQILSGDNSASLSDFYDRVGLNHTQVSEEVGWNLDNLLELTFSTTMDEKSRPVLAFDYKVVPVRNYFRGY
jgi:hypothetical protein